MEVVSADTSYAIRRDINADHHINKFGECRGGAIAIVEISGPDPFNNYLSTSGTLACGTEYSNRFPLLGTHVNNNECAGDIYVGRKLQDGWWVKSAVPGDTGPSYHLCRGSGRFVEYDVRSIEMVRRELL